MPPLYTDTHPDIEALQIGLIRQMPAWRKMTIMDEMHQMVKSLALTGIRNRHPDATAVQQQRLLAELLLGAELAQKVYDDAG